MLKQRSQPKNQSGFTQAPSDGAGFTLLELLVVIAIIGLLTGVVMIALQNARIRGRDAKRAGDVRQVITSLEQYRISHGSFPTGTASAASAGTGAALDNAAAFDQSVEPFMPNFLPAAPIAPAPADGNCVGTVGRGNNNYWYDAADDGSTFTITFCLGKDTGQWPAGIRSATPDVVQ